DGRMVSINAMLVAKVSLNISQIMQKRLIVTGSTLRRRSADFKAQLAEEIERDVWPLIAQEKFQPIVKIFPYSDLVSVHTYFESGFNCGKFVLTWNLENDI